MGEVNLKSSKVCLLKNGAWVKFGVKGFIQYKINATINKVPCKARFCLARFFIIVNDEQKLTCGFD